MIGVLYTDLKVKLLERGSERVSVETRDGVAGVLKGVPELHQRGGGQEMGRRAGTENLIGIAGFAAAAEAAALSGEYATLAVDAEKIMELANRLSNNISRLNDLVRNKGVR